MSTSPTPVATSPPEKASAELFSPTPSYHSKQEAHFPLTPEAHPLGSIPLSPHPQFSNPQSPPPRFSLAQSPSPASPLDGPPQIYAHPSISSPTPTNLLVQQHPSATYQYAAPGHFQQPYEQRSLPQNKYQTSIAIPNLGMGAAPVDCPVCGVRTLTSISYHPGNTTHAWAVIAFLITLVFCFVPYMLSSLKNVQHRCGSCGVLLATWHRSGHVEAHTHA